MKQSLSDLYHEAMDVADQAAADACFEKIVAACQERDPEMARSEIERIQRSNLGYMAGYYSSATRERVERLFRCEHPVFGKIAEKGEPGFGEALLAGFNMARRHAGKPAVTLEEARRIIAGEREQ